MSVHSSYPAVINVRTCCHGVMATRLGAGKRFLYRLPIPLYQAGLERVLGRRFLCLDHKGRVTGVIRRTVLEVIAHDGRGPVVPVAFGPGSD